MWGALNFVKKVNMSENVAPTNDIIFRRVIMDYYHRAMNYSVETQIFLTTPKKNRRGRVDARGYPFRSAFVKLYKFTQNLVNSKQNADIEAEISRWLNTIPEFKTEEETTRYYQKGIELLDTWGRILIENSIIEFR